MSTVKKLRYLGIDPGTNVLGYAIIEVVKKQVQIIDVGVINMKKLDSHTIKLKHIFLRIQGLIKQYNPYEMAIEAPFYGKNVQSMLKLGRAQGVAMAAAMTNQVEVTEYSPRQIKQAVTGNGNASKEQVAAMLETILNTKIDYLSNDASDALAVALCHYYRAGNRITGTKRYKDWNSYLSDNPSKKAKF